MFYCIESCQANKRRAYHGVYLSTNWVAAAS